MSFPLVGNLRIAEAITNFLKEKRIPHAMMIEGDVGTGRHTLARFLAEAGVCDGENPPCKTCAQCGLGENHPDITVVSPEEDKKNISVAQIRELRAEAFVKPHCAKKRVFIITPADTLNAQAQNALLKILEEPPESCIFILVAESKASFLDTVLSRLIIFSLSVPSTEDALKFIKTVNRSSDDLITAALEETGNNIGAALAILSGGKNSALKAKAKEFLNCFINRDTWGMLCVTAPLEKKRVETAAFVKVLKICCAEAVKANPAKTTAKFYHKLYEELSLREKSLVSNINLGLFFSALVSKADKIASGK